ncbi:hypothetical protein JNL27_10255 [bacterium]|nr:hypothetical protein [bacterium]
MKTLLCVITSTSLMINGCMMMGMGDMSHSSHSNQGAEQSRSVEAQNNAVKAVLTVPTLAMGKESEIVVNVYDRHGMDISGAKITLQFDADKNMKEHQNHGSSGEEESIVTETSKKGMYSLKHRFEDHGSIRIMVKISYPENSDPLVLAMTSEVMHMQESHGGRSMTPMIIIGIAVMAAMMVFMIGRNNY